MATVSEPNLNEPVTSRASAASWIPANPAPLGLMGFGTTTLVLSLMNANLVNLKRSSAIATETRFGRIFMAAFSAAGA